MRYVTLGDPHLGRKFRTGVPLDRIGDREAMVWRDFQKSLTEPGDVDLHVCMGDLFDSYLVAPEVLLNAYNVYETAAENNPGVEFIILRGNHDQNKDTDRKSVFDIFTQIVDHIPNVTVITKPFEIGGFGFVPYDVFTSAEEQVSCLSADVKTAFMHHDYVDFGGDHVIPTKKLADKGIIHIINGHDHVARTETRHGVTVEMTGSMQPYSHAEDPEGAMYRTVHLEDVPEDCRNLNLRVILRDGEDMPTDLDCLSLVAKRVSSSGDETLEADVEGFEKFDIRTSLAEVLHPEVRDELMEIFDD